MVMSVFAGADLAPSPRHFGPLAIDRAVVFQDKINNLQHKKLGI